MIWLRWLAFVAILLGSVACPHAPVPVPPRPKLGPLYPNCTLADGGVLPSYQDVCPGLVTRDNRACVRCPSAHGCLDTTDVVYCVLGGACGSDPECHADVGHIK